MTTAIILAGGLGKRLRSVVNDRPKPMALIQGKPFLDYQMRYWQAQDIDSFILSVGYKHDMITDYFGNEFNGSSIQYAIEETPRGTGGGLMIALENLNSNEEFLLLNGDTYFTVDLNSLRNYADANTADFTFAVFKTTDNDRYMRMNVAADGQVLELKQSAASSVNLASGGVYWVRDKAMFASFKDLQMSLISFEEQMLPSLMSAKKRIFAKAYATTFIDIGVPVDYLRAGMVLTQPSKEQAAGHLVE